METTTQTLTSANTTTDSFSDTESLEFDLDEFVPEIFDCESDGSCSAGHTHLTQHL